MSNDYLRSRVRHYLAEKAAALSVGGDLNYNPGLLVGSGRRRPGRPRHVGRPTRAAEKRAAIYALSHMGAGGARVRRPRMRKATVRKATVRRGGVRHGNVAALSAWHDHLAHYRMMHPGMPYREAQHEAKASFHHM